MAHIHRKGPIDPIQVDVKLSSGVPANTINIGDLVALESFAAVPAQNFTWDTDEATTQTNFAAAFAGMSTSRSRASTTDTRDLQITVDTDGYIEMDCVSDNYDLGEYVGPDSESSQLKQTVKVVSAKSKAVAVVIEKAPAASTRVLCRLVNTIPKR